MQDILNYMYNLERFGWKLGLEVIEVLMDKLGNPQNNFKSIHIAGTNGKGSTAAFISYILQKAGYKVGLYTSPHLVKFNERIKINGELISDKDLARLAGKIKLATEEHNIQATFFEFTTALAFSYFAEEKVDIAVVETGLGGRLDATNVLNPLISVITNISFDHQKYLGDTLEKIASEKAAIIKQGGLVVTGCHQDDVLEVIKQECVAKNASLFTLNNSYVVNGSNLKKQNFVSNNCEYEISLLGEHQIKNALLAILVVEILEKKNTHITKEQIKAGLRDTVWPGRLQFIKENVLLDSAHNIAGMEKLVKFVSKLPNKKVLVLGFSEDKDISKMCELIVHLFETIILTKGNYKPVDLDILEKEVKKFNKKVILKENNKDATNEALFLAKNEDLILITGSIYLIGPILANFSN